MELEYDLVNAATLGNIERVRNLLNNGVDINASTYYGDTALMAASNWGHIDTVQLLLDRGADINIENDRRLTASTLALMNEHYDIVVLLGNYHKADKPPDELLDEPPDEPDRDLQKYESARNIQRRFRANRERRQLTKNSPRNGKRLEPATSEESIRQWVELTKQFPDGDPAVGYVQRKRRKLNKGGKKKRKKTKKKRKKTKKKRKKTKKKSKKKK